MTLYFATLKLTHGNLAGEPTITASIEADHYSLAIRMVEFWQAGVEASDPRIHVSIESVGITKPRGRDVVPLLSPTLLRGAFDKLDLKEK